MDALFLTESLRQQLRIPEQGLCSGFDMGWILL
jgi:hypothetical protein